MWVQQETSLEIVAFFGDNLQVLILAQETWRGREPTYQRQYHCYPLSNDGAGVTASVVTHPAF